MSEQEVKAAEGEIETPETPVAAPVKKKTSKKKASKKKVGKKKSAKKKAPARADSTEATAVAESTDGAPKKKRRKKKVSKKKKVGARRGRPVGSKNRTKADLPVVRKKKTSKKKAASKVAGTTAGAEQRVIQALDELRLAIIGLIEDKREKDEIIHSIRRDLNTL